MTTIRQLLAKKGDAVWTIGPGVSVYEAIALMAEHEVGALMVVAGERPVGIVSERDYARKVILKGRSSKKTRVEEIMTKSVKYAALDDAIDACLVVMTDNRIRHLPVADNGRLVGMVSIGDLVKAIIEEQRTLIEQLESYIAG